MNIEPEIPSEADLEGGPLHMSRTSSRSHQSPPSITFVSLLPPILIPFLLCSYFSNNPLVIMSVSVGAIVGNTSQFFHKYSHLRNHENDTDARGKYLYNKVPNILKKLQDGNIILNPKEHSIHHDGRAI